MENKRRIAETVSIYRTGEQPSDFVYWQSQPYEARIEALEQIRREYHLWTYHAEPRLFGFDSLGLQAGTSPSRIASFDWDIRLHGSIS